MSAVVQHASTIGFTAGFPPDTVAVTLPSPAAAGNLIVALVADQGGEETAPISAPTDNLGSVYASAIQASSLAAPSSRFAGIWYAIAPSTAPLQSLTVQITEPLFFIASLTVFEIQGYDTLDVTGSLLGDGTEQADWSVSGSKPTSIASELVMALFAGNQQSWTPQVNAEATDNVVKFGNGGFVIASNFVEAFEVTSKGSVTASASNSANTTLLSALVATFYKTVVPPPPPSRVAVRLKRNGKVIRVPSAAVTKLISRGIVELA